MCHQTIATIPTPSPDAQRSLQILRTEDDGGSVRCDEAEVVVGDGRPTDGASLQNRVQRSIDGPVTREAVTRSLVVVPGECRRPGRAVGSEPRAAGIAFGFDSAELTAGVKRDLDGVAAALDDPRLVTARLTLEGHTTLPASRITTCGCRNGAPRRWWRTAWGAASRATGSARPASANTACCRSTRRTTSGSAVWKSCARSER